MIETKERRQINSKGYVSVPSLTNVPISSISRDKLHLAISYKALAFHEDRKNASLAAVSGFVIEEKRLPPVFNPDLGVYQCAEGTRYGGRFTDRFGRGCGGGVLRRLGSALGRLGDSSFARRLDNLGEQRDLRRLARYSARQSYRDELGRIRREYPGLGRRALRRLGGTFQRVDNNLGVAPTPPQPRRRLRGRTPGTPSIVQRARDRSRESFLRARDRMRTMRRRKQNATRVRLSQRLRNRRARRAAAPRTPGIVSRAADRAGAAYERLIDRALYGRRGRRGRRGLAGQGGSTVVLPQKPKTPRAKKKKAVVQKTKPKPAVPQKKVKKTGFLNLPDISPTQYLDLVNEANKQLNTLEDFWRKRLGIADGDPIPEALVDKYIDDAIKEYEAKKAAGTLTPSDGAYLGMLKANRNDLKALQKFKEENDKADSEAAIAALNKVGPTRRQKLIDSIGVSTPTKPKPAPKPKPTKKPKDKPTPKPEAETPNVPDEVAEPEEEVKPETPTPEKIDIWAVPEAETPEPVVTEETEEQQAPDFIKPEDSPDATVEISDEPISLEDDEWDEVWDPTQEGVVESDEEDFPDATPVVQPAEEMTPDSFVLPEPGGDQELIVDEATDPILTPPIPAPQLDDGLEASVSEDGFDAVNVELAAIAAGQEASSASNVLDNVNPDGTIGEKFPKTPEGLEQAIQKAKELSTEADAAGIPEPLFIFQTDDGQFAISTAELAKPEFLPPNWNKATSTYMAFQKGNALGFMNGVTLKKQMQKYGHGLSAETFVAGPNKQIAVTTKGLRHTDVLPILKSAHDRARAIGTTTFAVIFYDPDKKKSFLFEGTPDEIDAMAKKTPKSPQMWIIAGFEPKKGRALFFRNNNWTNHIFSKDDSIYFANGTKYQFSDETHLSTTNTLKAIAAELEQTSSLSDSDFEAGGPYLQSYNHSKTISIGNKFITNHKTGLLKEGQLVREWAIAEEAINKAILNGNMDSFRIIRRSPNATKNQFEFNVFISNQAGSTYISGDLGVAYWQSSELPSDTGPQSIYSVLSSSTAGGENYLIYIRPENSGTGSGVWQYVNEDRYKTFVSAGIIDAGDYLFKYDKNSYSSMYSKWTLNSGFSTTGNSSIVQEPSVYEAAVDTFAFTVAEKFPELNLPKSVTPQDVIEIDETYVYSADQAEIIKLDPQQVQSLVTQFVETPTGANFVKAAVIGEKNEILQSTKFENLTPSMLDDLAQKAQTSIDQALANIPQESEAYGAIFDINKLSHNTLVRAMAKKQAIDDLKESITKAKEIQELSKAIAQKLGLTPGAPLSTLTKEEVANLTAQDILSSPLINSISDLVDALNGGLVDITAEALAPSNVPYWWPAIIKGSSDAPPNNELNIAVHQLKYQEKSKAIDDIKETVGTEIKNLISQVQYQLFGGLNWSGVGKFDKGDSSLDFVSYDKSVLPETSKFISGVSDKSPDEVVAFLEGKLFSRALKDALYSDLLNAKDQKFTAIVALNDIERALLHATSVEEALAFYASAELIVELADTKGEIKDGEVVLSLTSLADLTPPTSGILIDALFEQTQPNKILKELSDLNMVDTLGLMAEEAAVNKRPLLLVDMRRPGWSENRFFILSIDDIDKTPGLKDQITSVVAAVTPDGKFYIGKTDSPTAAVRQKWFTKMKKWGTGGFEKPPGAFWVFDSDDAMKNLDDLWANKDSYFPSGIAGDWTIRAKDDYFTPTVKGKLVSENPLDKALITTEMLELGTDAGVSIPLYEGLNALNKQTFFDLTMRNAVHTGVMESPHVVLVAAVHKDGTHMKIVKFYYKNAEERARARAALKDYDIVGLSRWRNDNEAQMLSVYRDQNLGAHEPFWDDFWSLTNTPSGPAPTEDAFDKLGNTISWYNDIVRPRDVFAYESFSRARKAMMKRLQTSDAYQLASVKFAVSLNDWLLDDSVSSTLSPDAAELLGKIISPNGHKYPESLGTPLSTEYVFATTPSTNLELILPELSKLFEYLENVGALPSTGSPRSTAPEYGLFHKLNDDDDMSRPLGLLISTLNARLLESPELASDGKISKEELHNIIVAATAKFTSNGVTGDSAKFIEGLLRQIDALAVGGAEGRRAIDRLLDYIDDPDVVGSIVTDPNGINVVTLSTEEQLNLLRTLAAKSQAELSSLIENDELKNIHRAAVQLALLTRRSQQLITARAFMAAIINKQENDPEDAKLLRSGLRNYLLSDPLSAITPSLHRDKIFKWLQSGGYPDLKPAKSVVDQTNIPLASISQFDPSLLGSMSDTGKAIAHYVPVHAAIPDLESAKNHLASGGKLSEVPDIFLLEAIKANTGSGKRFLIDTSISGGYNKDVWGFFDTATPGVQDGTYKRYVVKFADRNPLEHVQEIMGSQMEHRLGLFAAGHRVASGIQMRADKNGNMSPQRAIVQEHIGNLFDGGEWKVVGEYSKASSSDPIDPESLGKFLVLNRVINHYDRTPANLFAVKDPTGKLHLVPIDDGNAFYGFNAKKDGQTADTAAEQAAGFHEQIGVGLDWFSKTDSMSPEDKLAVAVAMREATIKFLSLDVDQLQQEIQDAHDWTPEELAHIASRFDILRERKEGRDWVQMLSTAYSMLGVTPTQVKAEMDKKKIAQMSTVMGSSASYTPQSALSLLLSKPKRNLGAAFSWDGDSLRYQQVVIGSAIVSSQKYPDLNNKVVLYGTLQLTGEARENAKKIKINPEESGWTVLLKPDGSKISKPLRTSFRIAPGAPYGNKRTLDLNSGANEFGGSGTNYIKTLSDGTVAVVYLPDGSKQSFQGYVTFIKPTEDPDNKTLSISDVNGSMDLLLSEFGAKSEPPDENLLMDSALREFLTGINGYKSDYYSLPSQEIIKLLSDAGITLDDIERVADIDGEPYFRLKKDALAKRMEQTKTKSFSHRYTHHDDGEVMGFANVLLTGRLGSSLRRIPHGIPGGGWSTSADTTRGSNEYVFLNFGRHKVDDKLSLFDVNATDEQIKEMLTVGDFGQRITTVIPGEFVAERIESRFTKGDSFGDTDAHVGLSTAAENAKTSSSSYGGPEAMIYDSFHIAKALHVLGSSEYDEVMQILAANGITELAGIPINLLIVKKGDSDKLVSDFKNLRDKWIELGWVQ